MKASTTAYGYVVWPDQPDLFRGKNPANSRENPVAHALDAGLRMQGSVNANAGPLALDAGLSALDAGTI